MSNAERVSKELITESASKTLHLMKTKTAHFVAALYNSLK